MIKPKSLEKGDKIAIVSLSWGALGDKEFIHKYYIAKERLENDLRLYHNIIGDNNDSTRKDY